jgi:large subunit ribosomal protein L13
LSSQEVVYVDATDLIAGRMSSRIAKLLLEGKRVVVVNAEKALVSGGRISVMRQWQERLELSSKVNPLYGPIHHRRPDNILRRMVRGMVPRKKTKGMDAMRRLRIFMGVPEKLKREKFTAFDDTRATRPIPVYVSMGDLSRNLGWNSE